MKKKAIKLPNTAYQIYHLHETETHYPLILGTFLQTSNSQFQNNRAVRLLADWLHDYKNMNQVAKHKYLNTIPRVLKILQNLFCNQADINVCLAPFYTYFYPNWKQMTESIDAQLIKGNRYTLKFIWYLAFDFCQKLDAQKQYQFNCHLSQNFQKSLLKYQEPDQMTFKPLLQTVRMINIQKCKVQFVNDSQLWAQKMIKMYEECTIPSLKNQILIQIIGCRPFLVEKQQTRQFWINIIGLYFTLLQKKLPNIMLNNQADMKLLDSLSLIINFPQVKQYLYQNKKRFGQTLLPNMKKNTDPKNSFHYQKYYLVRNILIDLFYFKNKAQSIKQMQQILTQFNNKYISVLKDNQQNIRFFDCMCEQKITISKTNIIQIIKSLANGHTRKMYSVGVIRILVRVLNASSEQQLPEENINSITKSLSQCLASKINDPGIPQLRVEISCYYITLAEKYLWTEQKTTQIMLMWCQQFQRNNKNSTPQTIILLRILTKKHSTVVFSSFGHKLQALITDITYKLKFNKIYNNIPKFVSLLLALYVNLMWKQSHHFISQVCSQNPEDLTFVYLLQSQILTKQSTNMDSSSNDTGNTSKVSQTQIRNLKYIIQNKQLWKKSSRVNVYLYYIELFFVKISKEQAKQVICKIDDLLLTLFQQMYDDGMYHLMIHIAARVYFKMGSYLILKKLKSFTYFKNQSFDMLSRSFHKQTILLMSYMYCALLLKADNIQTFFIQLNDGKFMNSLLQGCDDFIGKTNRFYHQICYIIIIGMRMRQNLKISGNSNIINLKQIQKNIIWWQQANHRISFKLPQEQTVANQNILLIEQFKDYYEKQVKAYLIQQLNTTLGKKKKIKKKENQQEEGDDL